MKPHLNRNRAILAVCGSILIFSAFGYTQTTPDQAWPVLEAGLAQKHASQRLAAVRVLGFLPNDPRAVELAEKALKDSNATVRAAAATALGQMHADGADAALKQALTDKQLPVVMAAAHALRLLNDPACYEVYYQVFTGERKDNSGMVAQEMKVIHDPKQVAQMGLSEGIGYVPFAGIGWEALQTIMKDKKDGLAAKAALISALATDPDVRTNQLLLNTSANPRWVLRVAALEAITKRGDPTLLPQVEPRLADSKAQVKYTAAATIIHLTDLANAHAGTTEQVTMPVSSRAQASGPRSDMEANIGLVGR